ncbi:MAG TPA: hypothetical protein VJS42_06775 [Steroidobacteraceae bacterium]|nr:hypothetical protein [Steroidobacteraceae bacterium]
MSTARALLLFTLTATVTSAGANTLADHFSRIELQRVDDKPNVAALVFDEGSDTARVDFGLGGTYADEDWYAVPSEDLELVLTRKRSDVEYIVEERLVTYLNLSGEGPHVSINVESTTDWAELTPLSSGRYQLRSTEPASLDLTPGQIVEVVRRQQPDWLDYARQCTGANGGPCYTVTDQEFRISIRRGPEREVIGTFRIYQPNGC